MITDAMSAPRSALQADRSRRPAAAFLQQGGEIAGPAIPAVGARTGRRAADGEHPRQRRDTPEQVAAKRGPVAGPARRWQDQRLGAGSFQQGEQVPLLSLSSRTSPA
jgi:hypothetical protein